MGWLVDRRLLRAARRGDLSAIRRRVAEGASLTATSSQGPTPLMLAATYGRTEALTALVELGADVNRISTVTYPGRWSGFTALMAASCDSTGRVEPVKRLLDLGADPEDDLGRTAVDYAELSGYDEIVDLLAGSST